MGKVGRLFLWLVFWPAGLLASMRAGTRKRHKETLAAINGRATPPVASPTKVEQLRRIADRFESAGVTSKQQRIRMTADVMRDVNAGASEEDAVALRLARLA